jgi:hypothetical protein
MWLHDAGYHAVLVYVFSSLAPPSCCTGKLELLVDLAGNYNSAPVSRQKWLCILAKSKTTSHLFSRSFFYSLMYYEQTASSFDMPLANPPAASQNIRRCAKVQISRFPPICKLQYMCRKEECIEKHPQSKKGRGGREIK